MKILVTGGAGHLGLALIEELLKCSNYVVTHFSRHSYQQLEEWGVPCFKGDLRSEEDLKRCLARGFDVVIHLAQHSGSWGRSKEFFEVNAAGTRQLVELAQKSGVQRFLYASTADVEMREHSAYVASKQVGEELVLAANRLPDFLTCVLRLPLLYGSSPLPWMKGLIYKAQAQRLRVIGDGETLREILSVTDGARAFVEAIQVLGTQPSLGGKAYVVGQERPVKIWSFIQEQLAPMKLTIQGPEIPFEKALRLGWFYEKVYSLAGIYRPAPPITRFEAHYWGQSLVCKAQRWQGHS